jgi:predicted RNA-binding protein with RPS1 domain
MGQQVQVKLIAIDEFGKLKLSRKVLLKPDSGSEQKRTTQHN